MKFSFFSSIHNKSMDNESLNQVEECDGWDLENNVLSLCLHGTSYEQIRHQKFYSCFHVNCSNMECRKMERFFIKYYKVNLQITMMALLKAVVRRLEQIVPSSKLLSRQV